LKIAYICNNYLPFTGGVEIHVQQLAEALSARHQVTIWAIKFGNYAIPKRLRMLEYSLLAARRREPRRDGSVRICSLAPKATERIKMAPLLLRATPRLQRHYYHQINRLTRPFYLWAMEDRIKELAGNADILHCMAFGDLGIAAERAARRADIPFVCTPFVHPGQWGDGPDDVKLYQQSDAVIALLQTDFAYLRQVGVPQKKLRTIGVSPALPASIDRHAFKREYGFGDHQPIVLYLGRLMAQKGARAVLQAAPLVWKRFPDAQFVFIGPGSSEEVAIFDRADSRLRYLGRVADQKKAEALAACTMLCLPSMSEILPTVYLEAWSLGKPVIAGMAHGVPELVEGNQGGLCASHQPEDVAKAISKLLSNPGMAREYAESGKRLVATQFSSESVSRAVERLYVELVSPEESLCDS
jgi:glycosyltransferase involved in cell wall biosynthesis